MVTYCSNVNNFNINYSCKNNYMNGKIYKNMLSSLLVCTTICTSPIVSVVKKDDFTKEFATVAYVENIGVNACFPNSSYYSSFLDLQKIYNLNKIEHMTRFVENWNGTGGLAFDKSSIDFFKDIIQNVFMQPNIAPTGRKSLLLQYELDDKSILAFEVKEDSVEMVSVSKGDFSLVKREYITDNIVDEINNRVENFYGTE